jgi:hypothetical protein
MFRWCQPDAKDPCGLTFCAGLRALGASQKVSIVLYLPRQTRFTHNRSRQCCLLHNKVFHTMDKNVLLCLMFCSGRQRFLPTHPFL